MATAGGLDFAASDEEAAARYERWKSIDPFPEIEPALLNSADIMDYIATTGMIHPFHQEPMKEYLKTASCGVAIEGPYVFWDEQQQRQADDLSKGKQLMIPAQTIVFVSLEPMFRLPDYLAIRFNLRITRVYQGLLLGTGPLVDPGFVGKLSIPLHNLTRNPYHITAGEVLIWLEITKVSRLKNADQPAEAPPRKGTYIPFDASKLDLKLDDYLWKANKGKPIASSIPAAIERGARIAEAAAKSAAEAQAGANSAAQQAQRLRNFGFVGVGIGLITIIAALAGIVLTTFMLVHDVDSRLAGETTLAAQDRAQLAQQSAAARTQQSSDNARLCAIEAQLKLPKAPTCP